MNQEIPKRIVLTDTGSSLTSVEAQEKRIALTYLNLIFGSETLEDSLSPKDFYPRLEQTAAKTAAVNVDKFTEAYETARKQGVQEILSIHLSSELSSTCQNADIAAKDIQEKYPDLKIQVVDSKAVTVAQGFKVDLAQELIQRGDSLEDIKTQIDNLSQKTVLFCAGGVDSFKYLKRSGRLHGAQGLIASVLPIVPIIGMNSEGKISLLENTPRAKGNRKILDHLNEEVQKRGQPDYVGIAYTNDASVGEKLKNPLAEIIDLRQVKFIGPKDTGSVLAAHIGSGAGVIAAMWR